MAELKDFIVRTHLSNTDENQEAFESSLTRSSTITEDDKELQAEPQRRKSRLERLNPDKTPVAFRREMTNSELISNWISNGESVLLIGPSGIGKTQIVKDAFPNLIYRKLYNNMFPELLMGSMNVQTGEERAPSFARDAILMYATDEEKKLVKQDPQNLYDVADAVYERTKSEKEPLVIMLDELLNVKPDIQALCYTLVLNKMVEMGRGLKLPANTVIVATGNPAKYSIVSKDMPEPLRKRFDHIKLMEPKVGTWLIEYAIPRKLHPAVVSYIFTKYLSSQRSEKLEDIGYFYEEPDVGEKNLDQNGEPGETNDPRGWERVSTVLYDFEKNLSEGKLEKMDVDSTLKQSLKLREEWKEEFFDFYNHPTLTVEEVVEKRYTQADLPRDINEKFAYMAGLLNATEEQVGACREFIREHCDPEYLSVYDIYWAGNDEKRMEIISEFQELQEFSNDKSLQSIEVAPKKKEYKITIDEFWNHYVKEDEILGIHTKTEEQAKILLRVFDKMGKDWITGTSYLVSNCWSTFGDKTVYFNSTEYGSTDQAKEWGHRCYEFEDVDLERYLSKEEKAEIIEMAMELEGDRTK